MRMMKGTTILCVRRDNMVAMAGDGQVTLGDQVIKEGARKVRRLYDGKILTGFAGGTADAMTLLERFEKRLSEHSGNLMRAASELVKDWRTDRALRRLEAMMLAADNSTTLLLSGSGDILEPEGNACAIGSGAGYALAAARAFLESPEGKADDIARRSLSIASKICIYTNDSITLEVLEG